VADALDAYLERLPVDPEARGRLRSAMQGASDMPSAWQALQGELADSAPGSVGPADASLSERLQAAWAPPKRRGDHAKDAVVRRDNHGRPRLITMPPLRRASMTSRPWSPNPVKRISRWLKQRTFGERGQMSSSAPLHETDSPEPEGKWRHAATARRMILVSLIIAQTVTAVYLMTAILPYHGQHWLEMIVLAIYAILFSWVGAGFWTALMGFWALISGTDRYSINATAAPDFPLEPDARCAILVPICNEDVPRVFAGLRATYDSLARTGKLDNFEFYVLSDTSDPDTRVAELEAWIDICRETDGFGKIYYRRRIHRIKRKSGNVADWCRRWGSNFRYMIVLDADSVMSGPCLVRLVQLMEANPNAGIIQTAPRASGRETAYARIQQFATRVYGPLFTAGLHFWQLGESHYWGHNAILRVGPFMRHCSLSRLPGEGALGGEILSHDFVEAALMRRAGWAVWIAYDLPGSYEEMPPTLLDELKRDRRWCQGNMQNFQLFFTSGLHPAHRAVFMTGVMSYLSAPLWFLFLVLSTALLAMNVLSEPQYFTEPYQLFPTWPEWHPEWALRLFAGTMTLLFLPKTLALLLLLFQRDEWRGFGGPIKLAVSVAVETLFSALLAPIRMLFHTRFVVSALLGLPIVWKSPPRDDAETTWREAFEKHWGGTLLGTIWSAGVFWLNPEFLWWLAPVVGSLLVSIPMSVWSSRVRVGRWFAERRVFLIPEESMPPRELRWLAAAMRRQEGEPAGFVTAVIDPIINAVVAAAGQPRLSLPARTRGERGNLIERAIAEGPEALTTAQKNLLLGDPENLAQLHTLAWTRADAAPVWKEAIAAR